MLNRFAAVSLTLLCAAMLTGCAGRQRAEVFNGFVDVVGDNNDYRILGGSDVIRLQVVGSNNKVIVEDDAVLAELYIIGHGNSIELPYGIDPYGAWRGRNNNNIFNRPAPPVPDIEEHIREYRLKVMIQNAPDGSAAPAQEPGTDAAPTDEWPRREKMSAPDEHPRN